MKQLIWTLVFISAALTFWGCGHGKSSNQPPPKPSFIRGDTSNSGSRRASEERPQPWDEEKRRFPEDGLNLDGNEERARNEHADAHSRSDLSMESFSHPACAALEKKDRRTCPLLRLIWSDFQEVPGGASISVGAEESASRWLRWLVLCHVAFGKAQGHGAGCPLHLPQVRARVLWKNKRAVLEVITGDKEKVEVLRDGIEQLVP